MIARALAIGAVRRIDATFDPRAHELGVWPLFVHQNVEYLRRRER